MLRSLPTASRLCPGAPLVRAVAFLLALAPLAAGAAAFSTGPSVEPNPNPRAPLAALLRFATAQPVETTVTIAAGDRETVQTFPHGSDAARGLPLVGFRPGQRHTVTVRIRDAAGATARATREFVAPALPTEPQAFPPLQVRALQADRMEPGFTVISVRRQVPGRPTDPASTRWGMLVALDAGGEPVWYYRSDVRISDFERTRAGTILLCTLDFEVLEIDLLGNTLNRWYAAGRPQGKGEGRPVDTLTFHHEVDELPNGDIAVLGSSVREIDQYYTSETDAAAPRRRQRVMGDEVVVFNRSGQVVWKWDAFEHMDPFRIGYETFSGYWQRRGFPGVIDWSHANNLLYVAADDSFLVSFRYQSAILKIDRATKQVRWVLGRPEGWKPPLREATFTLAPGGRWFHHQHAPFPTARGSVIVFDNGNYQTMPFEPPLPPARTYSRAVEYVLDEGRREARQVWVSETGPDADSVVAVAMGNAEELPRTGNVLVSYGALLPRGRLPAQWSVGGGNWTRVREYTRTTPAQLVWEAVIENRDPAHPMGWQAFASARWSTLAEPEAR